MVQNDISGFLYKSTYDILPYNLYLKPSFDSAPVIKVVGSQVYCPGTALKIVTDVSITDTDNTGTEAVYIQISSGYSYGQDLLVLSNLAAHPLITTNWNALEGKLKLTGLFPGAEVLYSDFVAAIKDVTFNNPSALGSRNFSISVGQANYLPRNGHFYEYVSAKGIYWSAAKIAAEQRSYYGLQGYLATITAADEAQISSEQSTGTGWIGGSDQETEGVWKWVTGPEKGLVFWNGTGNGSSPNFAFWNANKNEPNNLNNEDYAHITDPNLPGAIRGSWNDMKDAGDIGFYEPKGYIVEYGGMPGDPMLEIAASSSFIIPEIITTTAGSVCGSGSVELSATVSGGVVNWYDSALGGNLLWTGTTYKTPVLTTSQTYYLDLGCTQERRAVTAIVNPIPTIISTNNPVNRCGSGSVNLEATAAEGILNWYATATGGSILATGNSYSVLNISQNTTYYVEALYNGCSNSVRKAINVFVNTLPKVFDTELILCSNSTVLLDASLPNMTYLWSTNATTQAIVASKKGVYTVAVTSPAPQNCTSLKTITVTLQDKPEIIKIDVNETTVQIDLVNEQSYFEYSIDGIYYQKSPIFLDVIDGLQTAYVRNKSVCDIVTKPFVVLSIPKFFTPNNDGFNDIWEVKELFNYPEAQVFIYNRFGILIKILNSSNPSWDGTYNTFALPDTDYWYVMKINSNFSDKKGHFSLKR